MLIVGLVPKAMTLGGLRKTFVIRLHRFYVFHEIPVDHFIYCKASISAEPFHTILILSLPISESNSCCFNNSKRTILKLQRNNRHLQLQCPPELLCFWQTHFQLRPSYTRQIYVMACLVYQKTPIQSHRPRQ